MLGSFSSSLSSGPYLYLQESLLFPTKTRAFGLCWKYFFLGGGVSFISPSLMIYPEETLSSSVLTDELILVYFREEKLYYEVFGMSGEDTFAIDLAVRCHPHQL